MRVVFSLFLTLALGLVNISVYASNYVIYSIGQDLPMGEPDEVINKNYYLNIGRKQGVESGVLLDVFRTIARVNPYENNRRYIYRVKIGEIEVIHAEDESSIGKMYTLFEDTARPLIELESFNVGDEVEVQIKR